MEQAIGRVQAVTVTYAGARPDGACCERESILNPNPSFTGNSTIDISRGAGSPTTTRSNASISAGCRRASRRWRAIRSRQPRTRFRAIRRHCAAPTSSTRRRIAATADFDTRHIFTSRASPQNVHGHRAVTLGAILGGLVWVRLDRCPVRAPPVMSPSRATLGSGNFTARPNHPGVPVQIDDGPAPGERRHNLAAFSVPTEARQGNLPRNALQGFPLNQVDFSLRREVPLVRSAALSSSA